MSTRSHVGILREDGNVERVYVHWDGYTQGAGLLLLRHAREAQDAEGIIAKGSQDSLAWLGDAPRGWKSLGIPTESVACAEYLALDGMIEYAYLFDPKDGQWYVATTHAPDADRGATERTLGIQKLYLLGMFLAYEAIEDKRQGYSSARECRKLLDACLQEGIISEEDIASARKMSKKYAPKSSRKAAQALREALEAAESIPAF